MVLTFAEEKELLELKHKQYVDFEKLRHKNTMEELQLQLEITKASVKAEVG